MVQSLAQKRARHALDNIKGLDDATCGNYLAYVKSLPATIILSGLGQAMAMEKAGASKGGDVGTGHKSLLIHVESWLCNKHGRGWQHSPYARHEDILGAIIAGSERDYISAQVEVMEYLEWLKKFAVALLKQNKTGGD
ncbi:MAG: type III-B CRISPR module-associated protein Cmr5 [Cohaesibacter sp.]|nr:type III-B CRISPR module-associated protein Cmr5 [Cohaesibacter sp.]